MSVNSTDPKILFGGTWERLKGGFLYGAVESYGVGNSTGTKTNESSGNTGSTTLTIDQIPSHRHKSSSYKLANAAKGSYAATPVGLSSTGKSGDYYSEYVGGGKGHTHSLNSHTHNIPYMAVFIWKRTA